jgi:DNA-binding transcriptional regulator YdaS (Cro superfamily)
MRLEEYMKKNNIRALGIARKAKINFSIISRYLNGRRGLSPESAARISAATGGEVTVEELLFPNGLPEGARMAS